MSYAKFDEKVARSLQDQLNCTGITENAVFSKEKEKENYRPRSLVDETLEYIDPTPNIYTLFVQFNEKFFWNVLLPVQVKWSPRMTSCAGICTFHPRNKECVIALSNPLLKLRPRKDLVETLLHEMIHAYLFLTNDNRDRDGHGPIFQSHMHRINKAAGTKITIYHTFHEEVKLYQQHWWRCNGPCQKKAPYFGMVRRAMNRAPGPNDFWWTDHMANCGGQYIKIKEPEKPEKKKNASKKQNNTSAVSKTSGNNSIINWMKKSTDQQQVPNRNSNESSDKPTKPKTTSWSSGKSNNASNVSTDLKKLGNSTNNIHGWGTGGPSDDNKSTQPKANGWSSSKSNKSPNISTDLKKLGSSTNNVHGWGTSGPGGNSNSSSNVLPKNNRPSLSFSGTLGGSGSGRSNLLDKYLNLSTSSPIKSTPTKTFVTKKSPESSSTYNQQELKKTVQCPNCQKNVAEDKINEHLDKCLESTNEQEFVDRTLTKKRKSENDYPTTNKIFKTDSPTDSSSIECPLCSIKIKPDVFNKHLDVCAGNDCVDLTEDQAMSQHDTSSNSVNLQDSPHVCLICDKVLDPNETLNDHLEDCVSSVFNDSNNDNDVFKELKTDETEEKKRYPCPVCMSLIDETAMNVHLDSCLK